MDGNRILMDLSMSTPWKSIRDSWQIHEFQGKIQSRSMEIHPRSMKFVENPCEVYLHFSCTTFGRRQNSIRKKKAQRQVFPEGIPTSMTSVENPCQIHGNPVEVYEFHGKSISDPSHIHGNLVEIHEFQRKSIPDP